MTKITITRSDWTSQRAEGTTRLALELRHRRSPMADEKPTADLDDAVCHVMRTGVTFPG
jgi:hypothetical protein